MVATVSIGKNTMTSILKLTFTAFAVVGLGTAAIQSIHAQAKPPAPAYVVNEINVTDPSVFADYAKRQGALIQSFGGQFLVRGGKTEAVVGAPLRQRTTIYRFDSLAKAEAWRDAPEQMELTALRDKSAEFRSFIVEGCGDCKPPAAK
jgi:uncharacterized protein (DUF1330 family)